MKKHSPFKTLMKLFALLASIGGILYLFKDKLLSSSLFAPDGPLYKLKETFTTESDMEPFEHEDMTDDEDYNFEHAFDVNPAEEREYVSLNITGQSAPVDDESTDEDEDEILS